LKHRIFFLDQQLGVNRCLYYTTDRKMADLPRGFVKRAALDLLGARVI
jgi:hypothetical protein